MTSVLPGLSRMSRYRVLDARHRRVVDADDLVARLQAGPLGGAAGDDAADHGRQLRLETREPQRAQEIAVEVGRR